MAAAISVYPSTLGSAEKQICSVKSFVIVYKKSKQHLDTQKLLVNDIISAYRVKFQILVKTDT